MDVFSIRLREEREANNLTQRELAERLGISQGTYKSYELVGEKNGREPSFYILRKICEVLKVELDYLFGIKD